MSNTAEEPATRATASDTDGSLVTFTPPGPPPAGNLALLRFRLKRKRGNHSILIGVLPDGFTPSGPMDLPATMASVKVAEQQCTLSQAIALLRTYNAEQLAAGIPDRKWALLAFLPKGGAT